MVLFSCFSLLFINQAGVFGIVPLYAQRTQFSLSGHAIGWLLALQSLVQMLAIFGALLPILSRMEKRNRDVDCLVPSLVTAAARRGPALYGVRIGAMLVIVSNFML